MNRIAMVNLLRKLDLLKLKRAELETACLRVGVSPVGSRETVIERLHKELWRKAYDLPDGVELISLDGDPRQLWDAIKNAVGD